MLSKPIENALVCRLVIKAYRSATAMIPHFRLREKKNGLARDDGGKSTQMICVGSAHPAWTVSGTMCAILWSRAKEVSAPAKTTRRDR